MYYVYLRLVPAYIPYHIHGESPPRDGFIPAETLVQNGAASDNVTTGGTLHQPVLVQLIR